MPDTLSERDWVRLLFDRMNPVRIARVVTAEGIDDPRIREGRIVYEVELSVGEHLDIRQLLNEEPA